jgi:hypothetical protein
MIDPAYTPEWTDTHSTGYVAQADDEARRPTIPHGHISRVSHRTGGA